MSDRRWPTAEQFDAASAAGADAARAQLAAGWVRPQEAPLSGEYADDPTPRSVALAVGYREHVEAAPSWSRGVEELCEAWERGYFDVWDHATTPVSTGQRDAPQEAHS